MNGTHETPTFGDYVLVVRRRRKLVALFALAAMLLAATYVWWSGPTYTSEASVVIRPILTGPFDQTRIDDVGAGTEAKVLDSTVVASAAAKLLHRSPADGPALLEQLTVDNPVGTLVLNIAFDADSPRAAQAGAQAFADAYLAHRQQSADAIKGRGIERLGRDRAKLQKNLEDAQFAISTTATGTDARAAAETRRDRLVNQISDLDATSSALAGVDTNPGQIIRPAARPDTRSGPPPLVTILGATVMGAILGIGFALMQERTDPRVRSRQVLVETIGAEPLIEVGPIATTDLIAADDPAGVLASRFRRLRVAVWPRRGTGPRRVLVTSLARDTHTADAVVSNLAVTAHRAGWRVLLAWPGYTDAPIGAAVDLEEEWNGLDPDDAPLEKLVITAPGFDGVSLLPYLCGRDAIGAPSDEVSDRLSEMDGQYDIEVIVTAPVLDSPEAYELAPVVDGSILVFDISRDTKAELERAIESLTATGTPIVGVVAVGTPARW